MADLDAEIAALEQQADRAWNPAAQVCTLGVPIPSLRALIAEVRRLREQLDGATRIEWGVRCGSASVMQAADEKDARLHLLFAEQECGWCGGTEHALVQREIRLAMPAGPWTPIDTEEQSRG